MAEIEIVIKIPEEAKQAFDCAESNDLKGCYYDHSGVVGEAIKNGTPLPPGHGRLGDLDELEQRISNFVEHDARITDEYTVARQRFIVDGIRDTQTIIKADTQNKEKEDFEEERDI